jgi:hypothetical protein
MSLGFGFSLPALRQVAAGASNPLGATLDLWFADMDTSYATGSTLDLNLEGQTYQEWALPAEPQGSYYVWEGYAPWEPYLDLNFVTQYYLVEE